MNRRGWLVLIGLIVLGVLGPGAAFASSAGNPAQAALPQVSAPPQSPEAPQLAPEVDPYLTMAPVLVSGEEDDAVAICIITCSCKDCGGVCGHTQTGATCRCRPTPQGLRCRA